MASVHTPRLWLAAVALATASVPQAGGQPATLSVHDVIRGTTATHEKWLACTDWMVRYKHVRDLRDPAPGTEGDFLPVEKVNARRGRTFFSYESQGLSQKHNPHRNPNDKVQYWILWKDGVCLERDDDDVSVLPEPSTRAYQVFYYTAWLFLDLQADMEVKSDHLRKIYKSTRPSEGDADVYLPKCLVAHAAEYKVRPQQEEIDGYPCHVLERPGHDVLWIDPAIGYMTRRRLIYRPAGHLAADITHHDYQQKAPGIWIPSRSQSLSYNTVETPPEYRTKVRDIVQNVLLDAKFNGVPDSVFQVPVPDGVRVHDYIRGFDYEKLKPTDDPLQRALEKGVADLAGARSKPRRDWVTLGLLAGVGAQFVVTWWLIRHGRRAAG